MKSNEINSFYNTNQALCNKKNTHLAEENFRALRDNWSTVHFDLKNSNYEVIETIGTGAYGMVCAALNKRTKVKVAIKKISDIFVQPTVAMRTYREIKILKHFKHQNIISIRDLLVVRGSSNQGTVPLIKDIYIVFDLMETDLHHIIHSKQPLSIEHVRYFFVQISRALNYIHSCSILHRDLKPSNLLVNENCELKVGDFGMSRSVGLNEGDCNLLQASHHQLTQYVATRWYRAPELLLHYPHYSFPVDLWSAGCILWELVHRKVLFPGRDRLHQMQLILKHFSTRETDSRQVDTHLEELLRGLLCFNMSHRITASQLLTHPFLQDDDDDEDDQHVCLRKFNFSFEDEFTNLYKTKNKDEYCGMLEARLMLEVEKYRHLKSVHITLRGNDDGCDSVGADDDVMCTRGVVDMEKEGRAEMGNDDVVEMLSGSLRSATIPKTSFDISEGPYDGNVGGCGVVGESGNKVIVSKDYGEHITSEEGFIGGKTTSEKERCEEGDVKIKEETREKIKKVLKMNALRRPLSGKHRPITAIQRQKEREAKKRKRKMTKKSSSHTSHKEPGGMSEQDEKLMERWRKMQNTLLHTTNNFAPLYNTTNITTLDTTNNVTPFHKTNNITTLKTTNNITTLKTTNNITTLNTTNNAANFYFNVVTSNKTESASIGTHKPLLLLTNNNTSAMFLLHAPTPHHHAITPHSTDTNRQITAKPPDNILVIDRQLLKSAGIKDSVLESGKLSATILADWNEVTKEIDQQCLDEAIREFNASSTL